MAAIAQVQNWRRSGTDVNYFQDFPDESDVVYMDNTPPLKIMFNAALVTGIALAVALYFTLSQFAHCSVFQPVHVCIDLLG